MDIRLKVGFFDHPKTIKLQRRAGVEGVLCLLRLWTFAAQYRPKGNMNGMSAEDIEIATRWSGEPGLFVSSAEAVGYLDRDGESFILHDWENHNGWAFHSEERSNAAKAKAAKRWASKNNAGSNADSSADSSADGNAPIPYPSPIPNPSPNPNQNPHTAHAQSEIISRLKSVYLEHIGLASIPPLEKFSEWLASGKTYEQIRDAITAAGGYPPPSRARLVIEFIDKPFTDKPRRTSGGNGHGAGRKHPTTHAERIAAADHAQGARILDDAY